MTERNPSPPGKIVDATFLEFFAGGGLARLGLERRAKKWNPVFRKAGAAPEETRASGELDKSPDALGRDWRCLFANDLDPKKCAAYRANFGGEDLVEADIAGLELHDLPKARADLAWASFPCQDLSLAGARAGLRGARSGLFFSFWRLIEALHARAHAPRLIVIENVSGLLTSNGGRDFASIAAAVAGLGYRTSALVVNASAFTPQSRPRLFIFGFAGDAAPPFGARPEADPCAPTALLNAVERLAPGVLRQWRWVAPRPASQRNLALADIVEPNALDWSAQKGKAALAMMSRRQRAAIFDLQSSGTAHVGAAFRRIRIENGVRVQRVEARFDGLAGCLRTPAGGSSRQMLLRVEGDAVAARLLAPREAARLMGVREDYILPPAATGALKLLGDGVAPPVVRWIAETILAPSLASKAAAA